MGGAGGGLGMQSNVGGMFSDAGVLDPSIL